MKKIFLSLITVLLFSQAYSQSFFVLELRQIPGNTPIANNPVWLRVIHPNGNFHIYPGITDNFGNYMDTLPGVPNSVVVSMVYDCAGNLHTDTTLLQNGRDTLNISCASTVSGNYCNADFYTFSSPGRTVNFSDSTNAVSYANNIQSHWWDFGDGTVGNTNPVTHTYTSGGTYQVCYRTQIYDPVAQIMICSDSICKQVVVNGPVVNCQSDFSMTISNGLAVRYDSSSVLLPAGTSVMYITDFGDGTTDTSFNTQSINHQYTSAGVFNVSYTVLVKDSLGNIMCSNQKSRSYSVSFNCGLSVTDSTLGGSNMAYFTLNQSIPPGFTSRIVLLFGDNDSIVNPALNTPIPHLYPAPGYYIYRSYIQVINGLGNVVCFQNYYDSILINPAQFISCQSNFSISVRYNSQPVIEFKNLSTINGAPVNSTVIYNWDYGDGTNGKIWYHRYSNPGVYNVCLKMSVMDVNGIDTLCSSVSCKSVEIFATNPCLADFTVSIDSLNPYKVWINNLSTVQNGAPPNATINYFYSYGDGGGRVAQNSHVYNSSGTYNICVGMVMADSNMSDTLCTAFICKTIVIPASPNCQASYIVDTANSFNGLVYIWNMSNTDSSASMSYTWDFGDGNTSTQAFPTHTYANAGMYEVCLSVSSYFSNFGDTCVSTYCDSLGVDAQGNLIYNGKGWGGWTLQVMNPQSIDLGENTITQFEVYPNPSQGALFVKADLSPGRLNWRITDLSGRQILQGNQEDFQGEMTLELQGLKNGLYLLELQKGEALSHIKLKIER